MVGRPEAVVKELIENSLDAGADHIQLIVKDGGKSLIQVKDNGCGMNPEDAVLCFNRHATSKISTAEDLENIRTMGFRGEALASIAAVSMVELKTKTGNSQTGTLVKNNGGEITENSEISTDNGTSVSVKNLFYNTPARRNFLKSDHTEFRHIYETFIRLAVANHNISFLFINNGKLVFDLKATDLSGRLSQIYGSDFTCNLLEVSNSNELISLNGFISKPSFTRKSRQEQLFFLNSRPIANKSLLYAVHSAYDDLIEKGDYPCYFLFLKLDPYRFDVNVHPSKSEVKFDDEKALFSFVRKTVTRTLEENNLVVNIGSSALSGKFYQNTDSIKKHRELTLYHKSASADNFTESFKKNKHGNVHELFVKDSGAYNPERNTDQETEHTDDHDISQNTSVNEIWQFRKKYIIYHLDSSLMIIDQHAAHERILYEQALERLNSNANLSQQLLMPITVVLNHIDYELVKSLEKEFNALGFDIEVASRNRVIIKGIPSDVRIGNEKLALQDMIDVYKKNDVKLNLDKRDNLAKSYACKHAIKAGDVLSEAEMLNLIDRLFLSRMPYVCPHGRPTIIKISADDLDRMFARKGFS